MTCPHAQVWHWSTAWTARQTDRLADSLHGVDPAPASALVCSHSCAVRRSHLTGLSSCARCPAAPCRLRCACRRVARLAAAAACLSFPQHPARPSGTCACTPSIAPPHSPHLPSCHVHLLESSTHFTKWRACQTPSCCVHVMLLNVSGTPHASCCPACLSAALLCAHAPARAPVLASASKALCCHTLYNPFLTISRPTPAQRNSTPVGQELLSDASRLQTTCHAPSWTQPMHVHCA